MSDEGLISLKQKLENYKKAILSLEDIIVKVKFKQQDEDYIVYRDSAK